MKTRIVSLVAASLVAVSGLACAQDEFENAMNHYENGSYAAALQGLQAAAEQGNPRAQEILGFMHAWGARMYPGVPTDRQAAIRWFDQASVADWPVSRYMSCALRRQPAIPPTANRPDCFDRVAEMGRPAR